MPVCGHPAPTLGRPGRFLHHNGCKVLPFQITQDIVVLTPVLRCGDVRIFWTWEISLLCAPECSVKCI